MNGTAGVLATVTALSLAAYTGLSGVVWIGAGCYVLAVAAIHGWSAEAAEA